VIGLIQVGRQARADRYMYIPMVGLAIVCAWGAADLIAFRPSLKAPAIATGAAALAGWAFAAWTQTGCRHDSEALFRHAVAVTEGNYVALENLGSTLTHKPGGITEAIRCLRAVVRLEPASARPQSNLCAALEFAGRYEEARRECEAALCADPGYPEAHDNLGTVLAHMGRPVEAAAEFRSALRIDPGRALDRYFAGVALLETDDPQSAIEELEEALRINPNYAEAHNARGEALLRLPAGGREAISEFAAAVRLNPGLASAHANFALALSDAGRDDEALAQIKAAVQLEPGPRWASRLAQIEAGRARSR